ncbi:polyprotein, partial [Phytophthora megakarya]
MATSQPSYIAELITKYKLVDSAPVMTPQLPGLTLDPVTKRSTKQIAAQPWYYRGFVGSFQYLVRGTRRDIANAFNWDAARQVLKYLNGTSTYGLFFDRKASDVPYKVYTAASFVCQPKERKSITGYCRSKPGGVSLSTAEAELVVPSEGAKENEWLWHVLGEMGFPQKVPVQ